MAEVILRANDLVKYYPVKGGVLRRLMSPPDRPVSKDDLFQSVWGYDLAGGTNLVEERLDVAL